MSFVLEADSHIPGQFLEFLARDIANYPERLQTVDAGFIRRLHTLVDHVEVDLDVTLPADDA